MSDMVNNGRGVDERVRERSVIRDADAGAVATTLRRIRYGIGTVNGLYTADHEKQAMATTVQAQLMWVGYGDIVGPILNTEVESVPEQPALFARRSRLDLETVLTTLRKQDYGEAYRCGPLLYISTWYGDDPEAVTGVVLGEMVATRHDLLELNPAFASLLGPLSDVDWRALSPMLSSIFDMGKIPNWSRYCDLMIPPTVEFDRVAFWLRGWLVYYALAELESMDDEHGNAETSPIRPRDVNQQVSVHVWPRYNIHDQAMLNRRVEMLAEAVLRDWVVFVADPCSWDEVMALRACASYAPMWVMRYRRQGDPEELGAGLQFPIASRVRVPGRGILQRLIIVSDSLWDDVMHWTTPPTASSDYEVSSLPGYFQYSQPRRAAAYKSALITASVKMFDRCASVDGFYVAGALSAGWPVKIRMGDRGYADYLERARSVVVAPGPSRVSAPAVLSEPTGPPTASKKAGRPKKRRGAPIPEETHHGNPTDPLLDPLGVPVGDGMSGDSLSGDGTDLIAGVVHTHLMYLNGFYSGQNIRVPRDRMRPPLSIIFSRQATDSTYTLVAHQDWNTIVKWQRQDVMKWMLLEVVELAISRQTVMDSLSLDWLDVYVAAVQRAQRPPEAIIYSDVTLGLVEDFIKEGATLGREDTSCELTNGTVDVAVKEFGVGVAPVFRDCVQYYAQTVGSRLERCILLYPDAMRWTRMGPDQALPLAASISYLNPYPLASDRYNAEAMIHRPTTDLVTGEFDTRMKACVGRDMAYTADETRIMFLNGLFSQTWVPGLRYDILVRSLVADDTFETTVVQRGVEVHFYVDSRGTQTRVPLAGQFKTFNGQTAQFQFYRVPFTVAQPQGWYISPEASAFLQSGMGIGWRLGDLTRGALAYARPSQTLVSSGRHFKRPRKRVAGAKSVMDETRRLALQEQFKMHESEMRKVAAEIAQLEAAANEAVPTAIPRQEIAQLQANMPAAGLASAETERLAKQQRELAKVASEEQQRDSTVPQGAVPGVSATLEPNVVPGQSGHKPHNEGGMNF